MHEACYIFKRWTWLHGSVWVHMHTCVHACEGQRTTLNIIPQELSSILFGFCCFHFIFFWQSLSLVWNLLSKLGCPASGPRDLPISISLVLRIQELATIHGIFYVCRDTELRSLCLRGKHFTETFSHLRNKIFKQKLVQWSGGILAILTDL